MPFYFYLLILFMEDVLQDIRQRIESNYADFGEFNSTTNPPQLAGYGKTDFIKCPNGVRVTERIKRYRNNSGVSPTAVIDGEQIRVGYDGFEVAGDLVHQTFYESTVYVTTLESLYRFIAKKWAFEFEGESIWPQAVRGKAEGNVGKYIRNGEIERTAQRIFESDGGNLDANIRVAAAVAARRLGHLMRNPRDYRRVIALDNLSDFKEAKPSRTTLKTSSGFECVFGGASGNCHGNSFEAELNPQDDIFGLPVLLEADLIEIPFLDSDINRTDGIKKKGETKLKLSDAQVLLDDVSGTTLRDPPIKLSYLLDIDRENWLAGNLIPPLVVLAATAGGSATLNLWRDVISYTRLGKGDFNFWENLKTDTIDSFWLSLVTLAGSFLISSSLFGYKALKNRPMLVDYGGDISLRVRGTEFAGELPGRGSDKYK